ncbi:MAG: hypothetical protein GX455_09015 [Phycisphaerae bacterium]|nr:hypothetical protein [Phycisphaerae bacterium]
MTQGRFERLGEGVYVDPGYAESFRSLGLTTVEEMFRFEGGVRLNKDNLSPDRSRLRFEIPAPAATLFLKRYNRTPVLRQIRNWMESGRRVSTADRDRMPGEILATAGIATPQVVAFGAEWGRVFEQRSFVVTRMLEGAEALERRMPQAWNPRGGSAAERRAFVEKLADFVRRFHATGYCHRDLYLAHVFCDAAERLYMIDLQRAFQPRWCRWRWRIKDLAELHYSAPGEVVSCSDRIRFFLRYVGRKRLTRLDRWRIARIRARAWRMADHDFRHGREAPFAR